jgi:hypothetical protein
MISNFFNNLFNDKKKPEKPAKKSGQKAHSHNSTVDKQKSVENTTWLINGHTIPVEIHRERRSNVRVSFGKGKLILRTSLHLSTHDEAVAVAQLKDAVTTPGGCTIDGLMALEEGKLRATLIKAVVAAKNKSVALRGH